MAQFSLIPRVAPPDRPGAAAAAPDRDRRAFMASLAALAVAAPSPAAWAAGEGSAGAALTPEQFGARGDGVADDTAAFQALGQAVGAGKGGVIAMRRNAVYRVGRQTFSGVADGASYRVQPILAIAGVDNIAILGNGATMKLNDGLHYGAFDPVSGERFDHRGKGQLNDKNYAATIGSLVLVSSARGVRIENLTLDGNMDRLIVGGSWSVDIQLHADGLGLLDVSDLTVDNVVARNNGLDGVYLRARGRRTSDAAADNIRFRNVRCDRNGRQGMSIIGGSGLTFQQCTFSNTSQGPIGSRPHAGVDVEPNGADWASNLLFDGCTFENNVGVGLVANAGNSRSIAVRDCVFWQGFPPGARSRGSGDAFWLSKDDVSIQACQVHGTVANLSETAVVSGSTFDDAVSPAYGRSAQSRKYLLYGAGGRFTDCSFSVRGATGRGLVTTNRAAYFKRCRLAYAGGGIGPNTPIASLSGAVTLEDVTFSGGAANPGGGYFLSGQPRLRGRVLLANAIRWGKAGPTGDIAAPRR